MYGLEKKIKLKFILKKTMSREVAWNDRLKELREYGKREGHYNLPSNHELYQWVANQRMYHKQNTLGRRREKALTQLVGKDWWSAKKLREDREWQKKYDDIVSAHRRGSELNVDQKRWVKQQRFLKTSSSRTLRKDRAAKFDKLPDAIRVSTPPDVMYKWMVDLHKAVKARSGPVSNRYELTRAAAVKMVRRACPNKRIEPEDFITLGRWIRKQRQLWKTGSLRADRRKLLEENEFDFCLWTIRFMELKDWLEDNDDAYPTKDDDSVLHTWVKYQRRRHNVLKNMSDEELDQLAALPGWKWSVYNKRKRKR